MISFEKHTLPNGLKVIVHQDKVTPFAAVNVAYNVGSKHENPDRTGFAHLFEHLTFGGSRHVPDFDTPVQQAGGSNNAFTTVDLTNYYITLPAQNIETAMWIESDRILEPAFTDAILSREKKVVIEEFNQRYLNQPYGDVWHLIRDLAYKVHPYRWPTIGSTPDHVAQATLDEVKQFFFNHYAPNNAVLVLSGNIVPDKAFRLAEKWFSEVPFRELKNPPRQPEPEQTENRELTVERDVPMDAFYIGWHMGARDADDFFAADLLSDILSNGKSSRFQQRLVKEKKLFNELDAFLSGENDPALFTVVGRVNPGIGFDKAKKAVLDEIQKTVQEKPLDYELEKVKNKVEAHLLYHEVGYLDNAIQLANYELLGDAAQINEQVKHYRKVMPDDILRVARKIFRDGNMNTLNYLSKKDGK